MHASEVPWNIHERTPVRRNCWMSMRLHYPPAGNGSTMTPRLMATAVRWPLGVLLTWWSYIWRITPLHRREGAGAFPGDAPPALPDDVSPHGLQQPEDGH